VANDKLVVDRMVAWLTTSAGHTVVPLQGLRLSGEGLKDRAVLEITHADYVIAVLSRNSWASPGFAYELGNAVFLISRLPGLIAHAHEERTRQAPMRQIDPKDHDYDGSRARRLPETRK